MNDDTCSQEDLCENEGTSHRRHVIQETGWGLFQQKSKLEKSQAARETDQAGAGNDTRWTEVSACDVTVMGLELSKEQPGEGFVILVRRTTD